ncbi:hypothetical protein NMO89_001813 [Salmonella enterica]|uniref:Uncharacterized protein n=1 Tax=Salmonella enterica subsp. houtenae serovar 18:z36,z38:- TaxID=2577510 RepID=A0A729Q5L9_SALHO|nr:hypothetical protein [Salmonella enterica]ECC1641035.1 hypothetical protein [Salmonella enterica subsp. houtenae]MBA2164657.1 hypothetical protein [Salmonella enterica subsp. houtenae serovar 18:z36,z38:-]EBD0799890.1 hypothetical protein [Salmonella enterica]EEP9802117.1 hypothetical protein [Salmonella enterica subsp. houtenae]
MTDTLKILKAEADQKKLEAENLRAQTKAAYAAAARAQVAYITEERYLKAMGTDKPVDSAQEATTEVITHSHSNPASSPEDYHRDKIAQSEAIITNLEYEISKEKDRLDIYKQNLRESQSGESLTAPSSERDKRAEFWLEQLQTKYRHYQSAEVAMIMDKAGFSSIDLCYLVVDMTGIIKSETVENLKVIDIMKNRDGLLTTPGNVEDSIYYHICKSQGIDLSTKSVKERPAVIREALGRWGVDDAFRESNRIMRHWASLTHTQRSAGGSKSQSPRGNSNKAEALKHYTPGMTAKEFRKTLENKGFIITETERTLQNWMREAKAKNENS